MRRVFLRILLWAGALVTAAFLVLGILLAVGVPVNLDRLREPAATALSGTLGRRVTLAGPIELVPAFRPTFAIEDVRIANPRGWDAGGAFARMDRARIEVSVLPLLWRRVQIEEIRVEGVELDLLRDAQGRENWRFALGERAPPEASEQADTDGGDSTVKILQRYVDEIELKRLVLSDISVRQGDALTGQTHAYVLEEMEGAAATDRPVLLSIRGSIRDHPYTLRLDADSLRALFLESERTRPIELTLEIADTRMQFEAVLDQPLLGAGERTPDRGDSRLGRVEIELGGERLKSLDTLAGVDLPPWGPWSVRGAFEATRLGVYDASIELDIGSSDLAGTVRLDTSQEPPRFAVDLTTETLQLDDFDLGDWSPATSDTTAAPEAPEAQDGPQARALLSPATLARANGVLNVKVGRVLSGRDPLGQSTLAAKLEQGRLAIEPWRVRVPGGAVEVSAALRPGERDIDAAFGARVDRLDYGILARRVAPETNMQGLIFLDLDLKARAPSYDRIMAHANGHMELGVFPEAFEAGIIDLWAVNFLMALVPVIDSAESSVLNCGVASLDVENGIMTQRSLMLDTSRMRVAGDLRIDFREEHVEMDLRPKAKRPQFFSLATPVRIEGDFEDFGIGIGPTQIALTVIRMATSVIEVPTRRLLGDVMPGDGTADCLAALEHR